MSLFLMVFTPYVKKGDAAFQALHTKATRIFQHIYLMYANDVAVLNEGTINHYNDALKKKKKSCACAHTHIRALKFNVI